MTLFLDDRWVWDFWTIEHEDVLHLYFLQAPRSLRDPDLRHLNATVGHATSTNLLDWTVHGDALAPGEPGQWDDTAIWTGSVIQDPHGWAMLYTGVTLQAGRPVERIGLARSTDLHRWTKSPLNPVIETDDRWYEPPLSTRWNHGWRDPFVVARPQGYEVLICARTADGPSDRRGAVARATSPDLEQWVVHEPVFAPGCFAEIEVPQTVVIDGVQVLIASTQRTRPTDVVWDAGLVGTRCFARHGRGWDAHTGAWLVGDRAWTNYAARVVEAFGRWWLMSTIAHDRGGYVGALSDPTPLERLPELVRHPKPGPVGRSRPDPSA
ncbi:glycosyl hydrolase family 32 [Euzebya tangerina]|uniref:glycosyl hydrolase family 32 n=1 Tax=Euzebya tangerina TaxID=591198 RepID=UPI000E31D6C9|nr:glycosyl hydrolase family 32 [Euzebya tangerina]